MIWYINEWSGTFLNELEHFRIIRTRPMHLTTFRVNIWNYFIHTLINRVKYIISKFLETYIQLSYLFRIVRTRPMHLTTFRVNIWGYFIPTLINRVKYIISKTMRLTYKCPIFLELSGQGQCILLDLGLISGAILSPPS